MSVVGDPGERGEQPPISAAAEEARRRLHEEIERVRTGVEEMLAEQERAGAPDPELRRELDAILDETRREMRAFVKKRVGKLEQRVERRFGKLEKRLDQVERERQYAEWRIHTSTEQMLDGLLQQIRAIADLLTRLR